MAYMQTCQVLYQSTYAEFFGIKVKRSIHAKSQQTHSNSHLLRNTQHKTSLDCQRRRCLFRRCLRARQPPPPPLLPRQSPANDEDDEG
jgi:hypothetical protein